MTLIHDARTHGHKIIGNTCCEVSIDNFFTKVKERYTHPPAIETRDSSFSYSSSETQTRSSLRVCHAISPDSSLSLLSTKSPHSPPNLYPYRSKKKKNSEKISKHDNFNNVRFWFTSPCIGSNLVRGWQFLFVFGRYPVRIQVNTLRTGLLNCLNARLRGLTFRHRASCI